MGLLEKMAYMFIGMAIVSWKYKRDEREFSFTPYQCDWFTKVYTFFGIGGIILLFLAWF
jgi:hypothetical protein